MANRFFLNRLREIYTALYLLAYPDSSHLARHSFATSVALANGVSIENVAKMLGHSDTKMTRHYARVLDKSIMRDMTVVNNKFAAKPETLPTPQEPAQVPNQVAIPTPSLAPATSVEIPVIIPRSRSGVVN